MPRMRVDRVRCVACRHFKEEGISLRCIVEDNRYQNWLGLMYREHPSQKNYNGECKDYEEINKH